MSGDLWLRLGYLLLLESLVLRLAVKEVLTGLLADILIINIIIRWIVIIKPSARFISSRHLQLHIHTHRTKIPVLPPHSCQNLVWTLLHDAHSFSLVFGKLTIVNIFIWWPFKTQTTLRPLVENVILPTSKVDLSIIVPDHCKTSSNHKNAICVFFDADFSVWFDLKMFDKFWGFWEEFFLLLFSCKKRVGKNLRNFDDNFFAFKISHRTNLFQLRQRYSIRNFNILSSQSWIFVLFHLKSWTSFLYFVGMEGFILRFSNYCTFLLRWSPFHLLSFTWVKNHVILLFLLLNGQHSFFSLIWKVGTLILFRFYTILFLCFPHLKWRLLILDKIWVPLPLMALFRKWKIIFFLSDSRLVMLIHQIPIPEPIQCSVEFPLLWLHLWVIVN